MAEFSVKDIIEKYYLQNHELLKHALIAKAEEDKKQTAKDTLKIELARIHLKKLDIELTRHHGAPLSPPPIIHPDSPFRLLLPPLITLQQQQKKHLKR